MTQRSRQLYDRLYRQFCRSWLLALGSSLILGCGGVAIAQEIIVTPLTDPFADPLVPEAVAAGDRPLSPLELGRIRRKSEDLYISGTIQWQKQLPDLAFEDWLRHLLLLQLLPDRQAEIARLGELGAIAWENNRVEDTRHIFKRLQAIQTSDYAEAGDEILLIPLAEAYQLLRQSDAAIALYRIHLETLDQEYHADIWRLIAQLATDWFDYEAAIEAYGAIETLNALTVGDREAWGAVYETSNFPAEALRVQRQLPALYLQDLDYPNLSAIFLAMARNAHRILDYETAIEANEGAFAIAWELKFLDDAETALDQLGQVYLAQENLEFAMQVYEQLLIVQNESYNRYGMMDTYALLGDIYETAGLYPSALISWQQGLKIAKELNHNIELFTAAIETLSVAASPPQSLTIDTGDRPLIEPEYRVIDRRPRNPSVNPLPINESPL